MRTKIAKKWSFDAAHQLPNHNGKCRSLHGHTYSLEVVVEAYDGNTQPEDGLPQEGMVMDFYEISKVWKEKLEPLLDHRYLNDSLGFLTTSENISKWALCKFIEYGIPAIECTIWETPSSHATSYLEEDERKAQCLIM